MDENLLNIIFISLIDKNNIKKEKHITSLERVNKIVNKIVNISSNDEDVRLKIEIENVAESKFIKEITPNNDIIYQITEEECNNIIKKNKELYTSINKIRILSDFEDELDYITDQTISFTLGNPNGSYKLNISDTGFNKEEDKLYTDGKVKLIEDRINSKINGIENATYAIVVKEIDNEVQTGFLVTNIIEEDFLDFIIMEVKDIFNTNKFNQSYIELNSKPRVYIRRKN
jgi:hypothetical protein